MNSHSWLEVSLTVDGELAEAVAEVLARFVPGGVVIESTEIEDDTSGPGKVVGNLRVRGYLEADDQLEPKRQRLEEALWHLGQIQPLPQIKYRQIAEADWSQSWKQHFRPIPVGKKLFIVPEWLNVEQDLRIVLRINPGMAFGTGTHPTTQLCLEMLEDHLEGATEESTVKRGSRLKMIDIGCGSGILGIAAAKLGVSHILGVDLDPKAVEIASQNAVLNGVQDQMEFGAGSVGEVREGMFSIRNAQLVAANILAPILVALLRDGMGDLLIDQGTLILSGILEEQVSDVEAAIKASGLQLEDRRNLDDWVALLVKKEN